MSRAVSEELKGTTNDVTFMYLNLTDAEKNKIQHIIEYILLNKQKEKKRLPLYYYMPQAPHNTKIIVTKALNLGRSWCGIAVLNETSDAVQKYFENMSRPFQKVLPLDFVGRTRFSNQVFIVCHTNNVNFYTKMFAGASKQSPDVLIDSLLAHIKQFYNKRR